MMTVEEWKECGLKQISAIEKDIEQLTKNVAKAKKYINDVQTEEDIKKLQEDDPDIEEGLRVIELFF